MYNKDSVRRLVNARGINPVLELLSQKNLPDYVRKPLEDEGILVHGVPCKKVIRAFVH